MLLWKQGFHKLLWEQMLTEKRVRQPAQSSCHTWPSPTPRLFLIPCLLSLLHPSPWRRRMHTKKPSAWAHQTSWTQGAPQQVSVLKTAFPSNHPRFTQDRIRIWTSTPGSMSQSNLDCQAPGNRETWVPGRLQRLNGENTAHLQTWAAELVEGQGGQGAHRWLSFKPHKIPLFSKASSWLFWIKMQPWSTSLTCLPNAHTADRNSQAWWKHLLQPSNNWRKSLTGCPWKTSSTGPAQKAAE